MHDLSKGSWQRVLDIVQERRVSIEVGESLCLELKTFTAEVIIDKVKHSALGSIGRVAARKRSQDRLRIRGRGFVNKNFRVRPEVGKVDGLQKLVDMSTSKPKSG